MIMPRKYTDEQRAQMAAAYLAGETLKVIAARFNTIPSVVWNIAKAEGVRRPRWVSKRQRVIAAFQEGRTVDAIVGHTGATRPYVVNVLRECGFIETVPALGRAAQAAGLTVAAIKAIAAQRRGSQSTFDLLQGMIDETMDPQVAVQCLEAELRAFIQKERKKWQQ